jgi:pentatricopeptide repeat protein
VDNYDKFGIVRHRITLTWFQFVTNHLPEKALKLFDKMKLLNILPEVSTYSTLIAACTTLENVTKGIQIHDQLRENKIPLSIQLATALINMYAKNGLLDEACKIFEEINSTNQRDALLWSTMIYAYAAHGKAELALKLYNEMEREGMQIGDVTLLGVLHACNHSGLCEDAFQLLLTMKDKYGVTPTLTHYSSVIDSFARKGQFDRAEQVLASMPMNPDAVTYMSLLGAARAKADLARAEKYAALTLEADPSKTSVYVILANMYGLAHKWQEQSRVWSIMQEKGLNKIPGKSWIDVDGVVDYFYVNDTTHEHSEEIHAKAEYWSRKMIEAGILPMTELVGHELTEEEKVKHLCKHR